MSNLEFMIAKVKQYVKKYKTKNGTKKETIFKTINLGSNTPFKDGDSVIVINKIDYDDIMEQQENIKEIESLNEQLNNIQRSFKELEKNFNEQFQEIQELKSDNKNLQKSLNQCIEKREDLHNALHTAEHEINKKDIIITAYKKMGLWDRIRHYDPESDVELIGTSIKNE